MRAVFTVYFEGPFWVGLLESEEAGKLVVARHVFGAEPSNAELLAFMLHSYHLMPRSERPWPGAQPGRGGEEPPGDRRLNPKRALREARNAMSRGPSSRSRAALSAAREASREESGAARRLRERELEARRFALRAEKRREARRGR